MRSLHRTLRPLLGTACALAIAVPAATALADSTGMQTRLGARLAGMGEHGIVNLKVTTDAGKVCWTFALPSTSGITRTSIHVGQTSRVLVRLGKTYSKKGCTKASMMTLEHLESKPGAYWVFVDTKGHPGDLRGKLFAGMAHM